MYHQLSITMCCTQQPSPNGPLGHTCRKFQQGHSLQTEGAGKSDPSSRGMFWPVHGTSGKLTSSSLTRKQIGTFFFLYWVEGSLWQKDVTSFWKTLKGYWNRWAAFCILKHRSDKSFEEMLIILSDFIHDFMSILDWVSSHQKRFHSQAVISLPHWNVSGDDQ